MTPNVPQPAGVVEPARVRRHTSFAYSQLLAFYRGELRDPHVCAEIEDRVCKDRRWRAHWESIRYLDLERAAAVQDAADLVGFTAARALPLCKHVAETGGRVFDALSAGADAAGGWTGRQWVRHTRRCVYCRRMQRWTQARQQWKQVGLPARELLLRDWLLWPCYAEALNAATRRLGFELPPEEAPPTKGDTVAGMDTILDSPH
jgi:hypothetical protein